MIPVIIPVKNLAVAKSRLAPVLPEDARAGFVLAMLRDVLTALSDVPQDLQILIVTSDPDVTGLAQEFAADLAAVLAPLTLARSAWLKKVGSAMALKIPRITTTMSSSTRVKPF